MKYLYTLISIGLIVPQIALASFWNPFSWGKKQVVPVPVVQVATTTKTVVEKPKEVIKAEVKVKKPDIKPVIKSKPKTTPTPVVVPVVSPVVQTPVIAPPIQIATSSVPVVPIVKVSKYMPSIEAINAFLANPTEQNLREYCTKAKTLIAPGEQRVLNESRTDYVVKEKSLYEANNLCSKVMGEYIDLLKKKVSISWLIYNDSYLAQLDNPSEPDNIRELKLNFNTYLRSLSTYGLIGIAYHSEKGQAITIAESLKRIETGLLKRPDDRSSKNYIKRPEMYLSLIVPGQILSKLKEDINKQIAKDERIKQ